MRMATGSLATSCIRQPPGPSSSKPLVTSRRNWHFGPLGDSVEVFIRREDAERFIEEVRGGEPELASHLRIEELKPEAGEPTGPPASPPTLRLCSNEQWIDSDAWHDIAHVINP